MYKLTLAIVIILLVGCKSKYPRIVHNKCLKVWAVEERSGLYMQIEMYKTVNGIHFGYGDLLIGQENTMWTGDTAWRIVKAGYETQFFDSLIAVGYLNRKKEIIVELEKYLKLCEAHRSVEDSIQKCHHSYE